MASKTKATVTTKTPFSFGAPVSIYQSAAELAEAQTEFRIVKVQYQPGEGYEGADRWLIETTLDPALVSMGTNAKRDPILNQLAEHLRETGEAYGPVVMVKSGRAYYFNDVVNPEPVDEIPF